MLPRILEPELMDTPRDAIEYDAMDHGAVNARFATDLLTAIAASAIDASPVTLLDLGTGTAQIPIELCRRDVKLRVVAIDAAESMLDLARRNVEAAGLDARIELILADAKELATSARFPVVASNSILHHIAEPAKVIAEAVRLTLPGGLLFHCDLARPESEAELARLVELHAGQSTNYQQKLLADSLRAALTVEEARAMVAAHGFDPETVQRTSDRHWTWNATR